MLLPRLHYQLVSLADIQEWVVVLTPEGRVLYFPQIGLFIVVFELSRHDGVGGPNGYTVMCVQGVQKALKIQP